MPKDPIINCHTHIFTGDHVPPYLAKTYVPAPFHYLLPLRPFVLFFRWWYGGPARIPFTVGHKKLVKFNTAALAFFTKLFPFNIIAGYYIFFFAFCLLYKLVLPVFPPDKTWVSNIIHKVCVFLDPIFPHIASTWLKILIVIIVFIFFETTRNMILFFARFLWKGPWQVTRKAN